MSGFGVVTFEFRPEATPPGDGRSNAGKLRPSGSVDGRQATVVGRAEPWSWCGRGYHRRCRRMLGYGRPTAMPNPVGSVMTTTTTTMMTPISPEVGGRRAWPTNPGSAPSPSSATVPNPGDRTKTADEVRARFSGRASSRWTRHVPVDELVHAAAEAAASRSRWETWGTRRRPRRSHRDASDGWSCWRMRSSRMRRAASRPPIEQSP